MSDTKHISHDSGFTSTELNQKTNLLWGANGRIRGLEAVPNVPNTEITPTTPGAFIINGILVQVNDAVSPVTVAGAPPYALTAYTSSESGLTPITFGVESYTPTLGDTKAVLATTDAGGTIWTPSIPLGIAEIAALAAEAQLTDEQLNALTSANGTVDDANTQHKHRGLIGIKSIFERLTNLDWDKFPHAPKGTPVQNADDLHWHETLPTTEEADAVFGRGGVQSADGQHTHDYIPTAEAYAANFGGPDSDASDWHDHERLKRAHGRIVNPSPTIWYVPQNVGTGTATIDGTSSTFTGSLALILGSSVQGGPIDRVVGIRYKEFARYFYKSTTAIMGTNLVEGQPVTEVTDTFGPSSPSGVTSAVPWNTEFTWKGIKFKVEVPTTGTIQPFSAPSSLDPDGDFFSFHGVIATDAVIPGFPGCPVLNQTGASFGPTKMHERLLSYAPLRFAPVLDDRYPEGGYFSMAYI